MASCLGISNNQHKMTRKYTETEVFLMDSVLLCNGKCHDKNLINKPTAKPTAIHA